MKSYTFIVTAGSLNTMADLIGTATVTVQILDANDNPPMFPSDTFTFTVPENEAPPVVVGTVMANDLDSGVNAMVQLLKYASYSI